jgi:hypothetical protein
LSLERYSRSRDGAAAPPLDDRLRPCSRKIPLKPRAAGVALHPFICFIEDQLETRGINPVDLSRVSGVSTVKLYRWRHGLSVPALPDIEAVLNTLGFELPPPAPMRKAVKEVEHEK